MHCRSDDWIRKDRKKKTRCKSILGSPDGSAHVLKTTVVLPDIEEPIKTKTDQKANPVIDLTMEELNTLKQSVALLKMGGGKQ